MGTVPAPPDGPGQVREQEQRERRLSEAMRALPESLPWRTAPLPIQMCGPSLSTPSPTPPFS